MVDPPKDSLPWLKIRHSHKMSLSSMLGFCVVKVLSNYNFAKVLPMFCLGFVKFCLGVPKF
jgi:hypothetical protein